MAAFERVVAGWAKITVTGPAKTLLTIHFGEKLKVNRSIGILRRLFTDYYERQTERSYLRIPAITTQTTSRQVRLLPINISSTSDKACLPDRFWLAGTGSPEVFEPHFSYKGYQYVQIEGWPGTSPPTASNVVGRIVHDDLPSRGGFDSSSDLLNKLHKAVVFTMLNNVHSIPEDCPTFEKNGWSGDAMLGTVCLLSSPVG